LRLSGKDGRARAMVQMNSMIGKSQKNAKLVFNRYGDHYFFAEAWVDGDNIGLQASESRTERAAEGELAGLKAKTETIALRNR
jgi:hypothetical protein